MSIGGPKQIREFVVQYLRAIGERLGVPDVEPTDETRLLDTGLIDSMGFIELVLATEEQFGIAIDLDGRDPSEFTTVGGFVRAAAEARAAA